MVRNVIGSVLALVGAAAGVASVFKPWYDHRVGHDYRVSDLFDGISAGTPSLVESIVLPFAFAALVTLVGLVMRSRLLVALAGLVSLAATALWTVRQGQANGGSLTLNTDGTGLALGVGAAAAGGVLLLLGAVVMSGRQSVRSRREPAYDGTGVNGSGGAHTLNGSHGTDGSHTEPTYGDPQPAPDGRSDGRSDPEWPTPPSAQSGDTQTWGKTEPWDPQRH